MKFLETTILKRSKESVFLDIPFTNMLILINHWLNQMCTTKAFDISEIPEFMTQLRKTKEIVDSVTLPEKIEQKSP